MAISQHRGCTKLMAEGSARARLRPEQAGDRLYGRALIECSAHRQVRADRLTTAC